MAKPSLQPARTLSRGVAVACCQRGGAGGVAGHYKSLHACLSFNEWHAC